MTHDDLVNRAVRWLRQTRGCGVVFAELYCANTLGIIPDAIGWRAAGWSILVECKTSRSDFFADRKKPIHVSEHGPGQERWYLTPPGLVKLDELPSGWFLAEAHEKAVKVVGAEKRGGGTYGEGIFDRNRQAAEVPFLLSACRRHALGGEFYPSKGRFKTVEAQKAEASRPLIDLDSAREAIREASKSLPRMTSNQGGFWDD